MRFTMIGDTRRNDHYADKPNEDFFWFDEARGAALVLDGVTRDRENGVYPHPSPARVVTERFAQAARDVLTAPGSESPREKLLAAVRAGNAAVARANEGFPSDFLPGTVGVLALVEEGRLHYAYVGDSNGIVLSRGHAAAFTEPQTRAVHDRRGEFTSREIRTYICNNARHPCGYGVWTGQDGAMDFLRMGAVPLKPGDRVILCTDGIDAFLSAAGAEALCAMDSGTLLEKAMTFRKPEGWMDDRTAVVIEAESHRKEHVI